MGKRRKGRLLAFQGIYSWEINRVTVEELTQFPWIDPDTEPLDEESVIFARLLIAGTIENIDSIDAKVNEKLKNWDITRIGRVELAILRQAIYSLMFMKDVPAKVTIDEAVHLAREFASEDAFKFINGVLDSIRKDQDKK